MSVNIGIGVAVNLSFTQDYSEVVIGTQTWMVYNWGGNYAGSKVYNDDENNRAVYGGLYTWAMVTAVDFAPTGWHVPSKTEIDTLVTYLGGDADADDALKETGTDHWTAPNSNATNSSGFTARGAGWYPSDGPGFVDIKDYTWLWSTTESGTNAYSMYLSYTDVYSVVQVNGKEHYQSVRLIKD